MKRQYRASVFFGLGLEPPKYAPVAIDPKLHRDAVNHQSHEAMKLYHQVMNEGKLYAAEAPKIAA